MVLGEHARLIRANPIDLGVTAEHEAPDRGVALGLEQERARGLHVDGVDLSAHVAEFCDFLKSEGKVACEIPNHFHGHAYQICDRADVDPIDDGVVLTGDSAGLAYPLSGEGIRPAVESGQMAADVIRCAAGDYCRDRLMPYARRLSERFGQHRWQSVLDRLPLAWLARATAPRLFASKWFTRHIVMNGWFLRAKQSRLNFSDR